MQTKLRRIESLIGQRSRCGDADEETRSVYDMQDDLQHEVDDLKDQNASAKEKIRKLNVIERGLATRPPGAQTKNDKYSHVQGKLEVLHTPAGKRYQAEADDMRAQIVKNNR